MNQLRLLHRQLQLQQLGRLARCLSGVDPVIVVNRGKYADSRKAEPGSVTELVPSSASARVRGATRFSGPLLRSLSFHEAHLPLSVAESKLTRRLFLFPIAHKFVPFKHGQRQKRSANVSEPNSEVASNGTGAGTGQLVAEDDSTIRFVPIEGIESLECYSPGGYHAVAIGDALQDGRYKIIGKLGHGGYYSTIWIARDDSAGGYVAVKICISDRAVRSQETEIMLELLASDDNRASIEYRRKPPSSSPPTCIDQFIGF